MIGDLAAVVCALCFALCSMAFAAAGRVVGAAVVNQLRILLAALVLCAVHAAVVGGAWPAGLTPGQQGLLVVSGLVGLTIGDLAYFHSLSVLGPRLGTLLMATFPLFAVVGDGVLRGVWPGPGAVPYMLAIAGGVALVLLRRGGGVRLHGRPELKAVAAGLLGSACQGLGMVLAKMAVVAPDGPAPHSLSMSFVRMVAGLLGIAVVAAVRGRRASRRAMTGRALWMILIGTLLGPITGVWLSMVAVQLVDTGRASVLIALTPVMMVPISRLVYGDRPGWPGVAGTLVAFAGTAGLMLR